jgi:predicted Zn-dependent protease with MMP-like domain
MARMSMKEFGDLVRQVMETLPPEIKPHIKNLVVDVAEEPSEQFLREHTEFTDEEIEHGFTLFGLFEPMQLPTYEGIDIADRPNWLWIFKNPHEQEFRDPKRLRTEIRKTVIHELAHHFGWSEEDLERFDNNPDPFNHDQGKNDSRSSN